MRPKDFTPPKYSETHHCIYDKLLAGKQAW